MITVLLNEANFEYDIHSLVKAFYAKEDVKVFADREKINRLEQQATPLFHMEISYHSANHKNSKNENETASLENSRNKNYLVRQKNSKNETAVQTPEGSGKGAKKADKIEIILYLPPERSKSEGGYSIGTQAGTEVDFSDRKETKNRLKQCLYQMLSEYTGQKLPWGTLTGIRPTKIPMSMLEEGKTEDEIKAYMADTYFATEQKINLSIEIAKREMELLKQIDYRDGYSLYVGIPFCPSICSYCSFSSSPIGLWKEKVDAYLDALEQEIDFTADSCRPKKLNTVYIGGGTPTTLSPEQLDRLLTKIENSFDFSHLVEYTVEAGRPDSITREKLAVLRNHNISRISINPQTMKQETLKIIGRHHTTDQTIESFQLARELGFDNINMDLILGLPQENIEDVRNTMEQIKALSPDNLTVHSLAIKRAARLKMFQEDYAGMQMTNSWETIDLTARYAAEMGLEPYYLYRQKNMAGNFENVGYAKPGKAGIYNILIMEEKQSILALGAGATTKYVFEPEDGQTGVRVERTENVKDITNYLERIDEMIARKRESMRLYMK